MYRLLVCRFVIALVVMFVCSVILGIDLSSIVLILIIFEHANVRIQHHVDTNKYSQQH